MWRIDKTSAPAGYLNVDKPPAWTSSDVVAKLRGAFGLKARGIKIGHGGTLDPLATGVLPICIGSATRFSEHVLTGDKGYEITMSLGVATDTYDLEGSVVSEADADSITIEEFRDLLGKFVGEFDQIPPMYSAIKMGGQPLYRIARSGKTVARDPRKVRVDSLNVVDWDPPRASVTVECGKGFYARSLVHDIGDELGCGAHVTSLRRTRSGEFEIEDSIEMASLLALSGEEEWRRHLLPVDYVIQYLPKVGVSAEEAADFKHGRAAPLQEWESVANNVRSLRVYDPGGEFLGLGEMRENEQSLQPRLVIRE